MKRENAAARALGSVKAAASEANPADPILGYGPGKSQSLGRRRRSLYSTTQTAAFMRREAEFRFFKRMMETNQTLGRGY